MKYTTVIFDFDGTLLYTVKDLADATNYAIARRGYKTHSVEAITRMVGNGVTSVKVERVGAEGQAADDRPAGLPEMKYLDPATGRYYSMKEWKARGEERRQQQAHYRVLDTKLTAKNATRTSTHKRNK